MINTILVIILTVAIGNYVYGLRSLFLSLGNFRLFVHKIVFVLLLLITIYLIYIEESQWIKITEIIFFFTWNLISIIMTNDKVVGINENIKLKNKNEKDIN